MMKLLAVKLRVSFYWFSSEARGETVQLLSKLNFLEERLVMANRKCEHLNFSDF